MWNLLSLKFVDRKTKQFGILNLNMLPEVSAELLARQADIRNAFLMSQKNAGAATTTTTEADANTGNPSHKDLDQAEAEPLQDHLEADLDQLMSQMEEEEDLLNEDPNPVRKRPAAVKPKASAAKAKAKGKAKAKCQPSPKRKSKAKAAAKGSPAAKSRVQNFSKKKWTEMARRQVATSGSDKLCTATTRSWIEERWWQWYSYVFPCLCWPRNSYSAPIATVQCRCKLSTVPFDFGHVCWPKSVFFAGSALQDLHSMFWMFSIKYKFKL